jgi:DNA repair exonuclease SbcCD ATPase subunit
MNAVARRLSWFGAAVLSVSCVAAVLAQGRSDGTDGSAALAPLTSELRQLRVAVEELSRSQTQTQALGVYLSAQQNRILQVAARLDSTRKDIEIATSRSRDIAWRLANINQEFSQAIDPERRRQLEDRIRELKHELQGVGLQEQQVHARETELSQALQLEESRWMDLISRLEQLTKK